MEKFTASEVRESAIAVAARDMEYEADLIVLTANGYVVEVEIKISLADLKRDCKKKKWSLRAFNELVSRFYYAMPAQLWEKPAARECVPNFAGVITVDDSGQVLTVKEAVRRTARPLRAPERFNLARVGSFRAWSPSIKHRARQLKAKYEMEKRKRDHSWNEFLKNRETPA